MAACAWKGVTRRGAAQPGAMHIAPAGLPAWVESRNRQGWKRLAVAGAGGRHGAARIGPAGDGGRTWYAGTA
jgi:hypothetical protein